MTKKAPTIAEMKAKQQEYFDCWHEFTPEQQFEDAKEMSDEWFDTIDLLDKASYIIRGYQVVCIGLFVGLVTSVVLCAYF